jgi:hypothetical protein
MGKCEEIKIKKCILLFCILFSTLLGCGGSGGESSNQAPEVLEIDFFKYEDGIYGKSAVFDIGDMHNVKIRVSDQDKDIEYLFITGYVPNDSITVFHGPIQISLPKQSFEITTYSFAEDMPIEPPIGSYRMEFQIKDAEGNLSDTYEVMINVCNGSYNCMDYYWVYEQNDLDAMIGLTDFRGDLIISGTNFQDMSGLETLRSIRGDLAISSTNFIDLSCFEALQTISGSLRIGSNDLLENLMGLGNLSSVGEDLRIGNNPLIQNLKGLDQLESIGSSLVVQSSSGLINLTGADRLTTVGGIALGKNDNLINLQGLEKITSISESIFLTDNKAMESIEALENITTVEQALTITDCDSLVSLAGLEKVSEIGDTLRLERNSQLSDMKALGALESIGRDLKILSCSNLLNLDGLEN